MTEGGGKRKVFKKGRGGGIAEGRSFEEDFRKKMVGGRIIGGGWEEEGL